MVMEWSRRALWGVSNFRPDGFIRPGAALGSNSKFRAEAPNARADRHLGATTRVTVFVVPGGPFGTVIAPGTLSGERRGALLRPFGQPRRRRGCDTGRFEPSCRTARVEALVVRTTSSSEMAKSPARRRA
jgi:hypothetical protein